MATEDGLTSRLFLEYKRRLCSLLSGMEIYVRVKAWFGVKRSNVTGRFRTAELYESAHSTK